MAVRKTLQVGRWRRAVGQVGAEKLLASTLRLRVRRAPSLDLWLDTQLQAGIG